MKDWMVCEECKCKGGEGIHEDVTNTKEILEKSYKDVLLEKLPKISTYTLYTNAKSLNVVTPNRVTITLLYKID